MVCTGVLGMAKSKKSSHHTLLGVGVLSLVAFGVLLAVLLRGHTVALLKPQGVIADEQHQLMLRAIAVMLLIAVPTLGLLYFFAWRYREGGKRAVVNHRSTNNKFMALVFWALPAGFVFLLASLMLPATQKLTPQKSLTLATPPLTVQVVALRWKWLFIYPEQHIASLNFLQIPVGTPVQLDLTADEAPMNSFWIPQLGGQLYAMTGHSNRLNLMADTPGDYQGSAAEINGDGFAGMRFIARASSRLAFDQWVRHTQQTGTTLDSSTYDQLLTPSQNNPATLYARTQANLYDTILLKYAGSHHHGGY
jgi:cytochrome o ubiquinol oxidase subunit 2